MNEIEELFKTCAESARKTMKVHKLMLNCIRSLISFAEFEEDQISFATEFESRYFSQVNFDKLCPGYKLEFLELKALLMLKINELEEAVRICQTGMELYPEDLGLINPLIVLKTKIS